MATYKPKKKISSDGTLEEIKIPCSIVDGIDNYQKIGSVMCYDTSTSDTAGTWTVTIPNITALTEGLTVKVRLKTSYKSSGNTLNVNGLGAKTVYFRYGSKLTSHYAKESVIALTYSSNATPSGADMSGWIIENIYDTNTTAPYAFRNYSKIKTLNPLYRYMICFVNKDGLLIPANNINNSTSTDKALTTESFNLFDSIYYYNSTIVNNKEAPYGTLYKQERVDLRYSFNTGDTLVAPNPVYLKVTADGSQFKLATDNTITQSLPTTDDGYYYCYLGRAYSTTSIELVLEHPIYLYKNGIIQEYSTYTKSVAENALSSISGKLNKTTYEWNKEFAAGSNGAISLGRYNIYDTQLTFDIVSTTTTSMSGKLVIAAQNGKILQAKVFGDATGALASKLIIYQSAITNNRSWIEVFCNFSGWSKNKVHIYGVALNSATVTNQMSSVTFTNGVPSPITSGDTKWNGTIANDLSGKQDKITSSNKLDAALINGLSTVATTGSYNDLTDKPSIPDISGKANLAGNNTFTGGQTITGNNGGYSINASGYVKGSWLQAPSTGKAASNTGKVCVLDGSGWIYYRTPAEIVSDGGIPAATSSTLGGIKISYDESTGVLTISVS